MAVVEGSGMYIVADDDGCDDGDGVVEVVEMVEGVMAEEQGYAERNVEIVLLQHYTIAEDLLEEQSVSLLFVDVGQEDRIELALRLELDLKGNLAEVEQIAWKDP